MAHINPQRAAYVFCCAIFLLGIATLGAESVKWQALTVLLFLTPLLCQLLPYKLLRLTGIYWGLLLVLQTLVSPWVPGLKYISLPPNYASVIDVQAGIPGVAGLQRITTDKLGYRVTGSIDYNSSEPLRIFAIGGSTTEEIVLDDAATWTSQLQALLTQKVGRKIEVINTGVSGLRAGNHVATLRKILALNPDMVIVLLGANDWNHQIRVDNGDWLLRNIGRHTEAFWFSNTLLGKVLRSYQLANSGVSKDAAGATAVTPEDGAYYTRQRGSLMRIDQRSYQITKPYAGYMDSLKVMSSICAANQLQCVFLTQPNGYSSADDDYTNGFWMTPPNESYTLSIADMRAVAATYNQQLLNFAASNNHPSCDIASALMPTADNFYDDCHFTTLGASRAAQAVAECLIELLKND